MLTKQPPTEKRPLEDYLTIEEAVDLSGYTDQYVRRMARDGKVEALKRGHFWLIERASLVAYMKNARRTEDKRFGPRYQE
jgi:excisionase family DNA binding protein